MKNISGSGLDLSMDLGSGAVPSGSFSPAVLSSCVPSGIVVWVASGQVPGASYGGQQMCQHCKKTFPVFHVVCGAPFAICPHCNKPQLALMMYPNHKVPSSHQMDNPPVKPKGNPFYPPTW